MNENTIPGINLSELKHARKPLLIPCLVSMEENQIDHIYKLDRTSLLIGRGQQSDIHLSHEGISRQHARIDKHENSFTIVDLQSLNGTLLNDEPIQQAVLKEGDKVTIGEAVFRFCFLNESQVHMQEVFREKTVYDHLTNIATKVFFIEMLRKESSYAYRQAQHLSCIMLDIDRLQKINSSYGTEAGDTVLRKVAASLSEGLRSYDVLCRYGGEEFAILLRGTALDNAVLFSERIRKRLESLVIQYGEANLSITVSIGVASLKPDIIQDPMDIIRESERHLQSSKSLGGNHVCSQRTHYES